jgi:ligand-binding sensor domain-containing protein
MLAPTGSFTCTPRPGDPWQVWRAVQNVAPVYALLVEQGSLWAATQLGVFRVDPQTRTFTQVSILGASYLLPLGDGRIWAAGGGRESLYYDGRNWTTVTISGTTSNLYDWALDLNGDLVVAVYRVGFYRFAGHIPPRDQPWVPTATGVISGLLGTCQLQAYNRGSLSYRSQAECQVLQSARQYIEKGNQRDTYVALDADGSLWWIIGSNPGSLTLEHLPKSALPPLVLPAKSIFALAADPVHGVWIGTDKGLIYSDGEKLQWVSLGLDTCTLPYAPDGLAVDEHGTVWSQTRFGNGIYSLSSNEAVWRLVPVPNLSSQDASRPILAIAAAPGGGIWATHGYDLLRLGGATTMLPITLPFQQCVVRSLAADSNSVWGGTNCGLVQFLVSRASWMQHGDMGGQRPVSVNPEGIVYAAGPGGLYVYTSTVNTSGETVLEWHLVFEQRVALVAADRQGGVWVASRQPDKLWYWKSGQATPHDLPPGQSQLVQLAVDSQNRLWAFSLTGNVLWRYDGKTWQRVDPPIPDIRDLIGGPNGSVGVLGADAIAVYDPAKDKQP